MPDGRSRRGGDPARGFGGGNSGHDFGRGHRRYRRPRAVRRLGALAREVHAAGDPPGYRRWWAPACCCATCMRPRGAPASSIRPIPPRPALRSAATSPATPAGRGASATAPRGAWVERLRVVLAGGRILDVGRGDAIDFDPGTVPLPAVTKNTAGYLLRPGMDWVDLFVGSEGTLGVVTRGHAAAAARAQGRARRSRLLPRATTRRSTRWRHGARRRSRRACWSTSTCPRSTLLRARFPEIPAGGARRHPVRAGDGSRGRCRSRSVAGAHRSGTGALVEDSWFATTANDRERFRQASATRCRNWSTIPCAAAAR